MMFGRHLHLLTRVLVFNFYCFRYSNAIDLWSAGCIYAELLETLEPAAKQPHPLFPGRTSFQSDPNRFRVRPAEIFNDPNSQINRIFHVIGSPSTEELNRCVNDEVGITLLWTRPRSVEMDSDDNLEQTRVRNC